jgi:oxygen-independent coproporphyrinogen-3 oxidase
MSAGYVYIGMEHFAKPDNELAIAQRKGKLYRNFQGYSTHADCDVIGLGITSIGQIADCYSQNLRTEKEYYQCIDNGKLAIYRGIVLNSDDSLRRDVISHLICNFSLDINSIEKKHFINFVDYFRYELQTLQNMQSEGLISMNDKFIKVLPTGRLLIRNICMVFDRYINSQAVTKSYSKTL